MFVWHIKYMVHFEGKPGWVSAESNILHASEDGSDAVAELFQMVTAQPHLDDRDDPPVRRPVAIFRLRGLTLIGEVDMLSPTVLQKMGLLKDDDVPRDIRGNTPLV